MSRKANESNAMFEELLIIETDREILDAFHTFLDRQGYSVAIAANGPEATRQLRRRRPDLIVIEPFLSDDWGERVLEQYRRSAAGVPVIGLSKYRSSRNAFPYSSYHVKPISLALLLESIRTALHSSGWEF
ncbi:MAG: response regulator [Pirellulaceae bacterium]|jgi:DNA-binding NtrC family response regulator|nr:response regulator [Pirellulaceae bacterium]